MYTGTLYGVGIGPGDPKYLTLRAVEVLREVDIIFTVISQNATTSVSQSVVASLSPRGETRLQIFSMSRDAAIREAQVQKNAKDILDELKQGKHCAFATLGDPMTYSTFGYVLNAIRTALPDVNIEIVPGITSFATLAAKSGQVLVENGEQLRILPSFREDAVHSLDFPKGSSTILLKTYRSRHALLERLKKEDVTVTYGERLCMDGQIVTSDMDAIDSRPEEYLSLMLVKRK